MSIIEFIPIAILIFISFVSLAIAVILKIHQEKSRLDIDDSDIIDKIISSKKKKVEASIGGMSWKMYVGLLIACPLAVGFITYLFLPYKPLCVVFAMLALFVPEFIIKYTTKKKKDKFDQKYAAALRAMASSLRSGLTIEQTIKDLGTNPFIDERIQAGFRQIEADIKVGLPLAKAFKNFADNCGSKDAADVASAIAMQAEVGGKEALVVSTIAQTINSRLMLRREIKTLFAETSVMVYCMDFIPWFVFIFMMFFAPEYISPYFESVSMTMILVLIFVILTVGSFLIHKMVNKTKDGDFGG